MNNIKRLTLKELEIMRVLWDRENPITGQEIIEASPDRTWKESSIYIILKTLIKKGYVQIDNFKPTVTKNARTYKAVITPEEYSAMQATSLNVNIAGFFTAFAKDNKIDEDTLGMLDKMIHDLKNNN